MEEIKPLSNTSADNLYATFNEAFKDYDRQWSRDEFDTMLLRRGFVPALSFGAFDGDKLVSFTLNGTGLFKGHRTAYDTGTGTLEAYRGKGLATRIFNESIPTLKQNGHTHYLLEVLQHNTGAISVYNKLGFETSRELNYFIQDVAEINVHHKTLPAGLDLVETGFSPAKDVEEMWDFIPAWQNGNEALLRNTRSFKMIGAFAHKNLIGYGIIEPASGDIPQIAVHPQYRRQGVATNIFQALLPYNATTAVKVINAAVACHSITQFLSGHNINAKGRQLEMVKVL